MKALSKLSIILILMLLSTALSIRYIYELRKDTPAVPRNEALVQYVINRHQADYYEILQAVRQSKNMSPNYISSQTFWSNFYDYWQTNDSINTWYKQGNTEMAFQAMQRLSPEILTLRTISDKLPQNLFVEKKWGELKKLNPTSQYVHFSVLQCEMIGRTPQHGVYGCGCLSSSTDFEAIAIGELVLGKPNKYLITPRNHCFGDVRRTAQSLGAQQWTAKLDGKPIQMPIKQHGALLEFVPTAKGLYEFECGLHKANCNIMSSIYIRI